jgi:hypothetical protein
VPLNSELAAAVPEPPPMEPSPPDPSPLPTAPDAPPEVFVRDDWQASNLFRDSKNAASIELMNSSRVSVSSNLYCILISVQSSYVLILFPEDVLPDSWEYTGTPFNKVTANIK